MTVQEARSKILDSSDSEFLTSCSDISDDDELQMPVTRTNNGVPGASTPGLPSTPAHTWDWCVYDDMDDFCPSWLPAYKRHRSVLVDTSDYSPVNFFPVVFSRHYFN